MSEVETSVEAGQPAQKPLWPVAAIIFTVVFTPALIAWGFSLLGR